MALVVTTVPRKEIGVGPRGRKAWQTVGWALLFWSGRSSGSSVGGLFENWGSGEPNDSGNEDYLQISALGAGVWNDLPDRNSLSGSYQPRGYVLEKDLLLNMFFSLVSGTGDTHNALFTSRPTVPSRLPPLSITKLTHRLTVSEYRPRTSTMHQWKATSR